MRTGEARRDELATMKVACPSCSAEYPVNERRLPASGLKMRCPKCGARFHVHPDGRVDAAEAPAKPLLGDLDLDLDLPAPRGAAPPRAAPPALDLELDLPAPKAATPAPGPATVGKMPLKPSTMKVPIAEPPRNRIAPPVSAPQKIASPLDDLELDLPAPRSAAPAKKPLAPPVEDLPTPKTAQRAIAPPGKPKRPLDSLDLDLPAPKTPPEARRAIAVPPGNVPRPIAPPVTEIDLDLDLEVAPVRAPRRAPEVDLPTPKAAAKPALADANRTPFDDFDLPVPTRARDASGGETPPDPPVLRDTSLRFAPRGAREAPRSVIREAEEAFGDLDLPMPKSAAGRDAGFGDLDLPQARALPRGFGEIDLGPEPDLPARRGPEPRAFGEVDLPAPRGASDLPVAKPGFGDLDLPSPRGSSDLPVAKPGFGDLDLPSPRGSSDLPVAKLGFDDLDLPSPRGGSDLPVARNFGDLPAPHGGVDLPVARGGADLPIARNDSGELELPEPRARAAPGGTGYGELDLGTSAGDDMEFADIPQREARDSLPSREEALPRVAVEPRRAPRVVAEKPAKKSRAPWIVGFVLLLLIGGGAALGLTPYGMFGIYFFDQFLPGAGDPAQVRGAIRRAERQAASDRWLDVRESLRTLNAARRNAGRSRELLARSLVHESLYQVRFEADPRSESRAAALRHRLDERGARGDDVALAFAADALRHGDLAGARRFVAHARRHAPNDPYVDLIAGEAALESGQAVEAEQAFSRAVAHGAGARGLWGVARVRLLARNADASRAAVETVLAASPQHGGALMAKAQLSFAAGDEAAALTIARQVVGRELFGGQRLRVAPTVRAEGWTFLAASLEREGRLSQALEAYERANRARASYIPALLGAGRVLLVDRPADALARFDSVSADASATRMTLENGRTAAQEASLGAARAMLALDRVQEAKQKLEQLAAARQDDPEVLLWLGRSEERLDPPNRDAAEEHYRAAITAAPRSFPAYLALAELFLSTQRETDAATVLEQGKTRVPESAEMRLGLGNFELRRNRLPEAIRELTRALELDADRPEALFALGRAQRRSNMLPDAEQTFDRLARIDAHHPRLALERGLLFEARGQSERAVQMYEAALRETPGDADLELRLGAAQVAAGQIDRAEATLERVRRGRPNSPEAFHFMGRVAFARGRYAEALAHYRQAVRLDPTRGEFHMHVAWAALENNDLGEALTSAEAAVQRDPSLAEAYWIRGEIKRRSGHPQDALADLTHALELKPQLHQVHASMGDAYEEIGRLSDAIASYQRAVERVDTNGGWWWRLGRLRMDRGDRAGAQQALERATLLGEASSPLPRWLADAHRIYGDALRLGGRRDQAGQHYRRYLDLAPPSAMDRTDVRRTLTEMGQAPPD